jgi:hypothetical protein
MPLTTASQVSVNTTAGNVTVTTASSAPISFAGLFSLHPAVSAVAVASWKIGVVHYSIFTGNQSCASGTGLQIASNGGGRAAVTGLYSDGVINNSDNSGAANFQGGQYSVGTSPNCSANSTWQTKNTAVAPGSLIPYPEIYTEPVINSSTLRSEPSSAPIVTPGQCTFAATYFTTDASKVGTINAVNYPGIYCVIPSAGSSTIPNAYSAPTDCADGVNRGSSGGKTTNADLQPGSIYIGSVTPTGGYEFVGPCVVANGVNFSSTTSVNPTAAQPAPIIYGTTQTDTTNTCLNASSTPPNLVNTSEVVNSPDNVFLDGNNLTLSTPIYAPCGTVELFGNTQFAAFIEAANVLLDKNNFSSFAGNGPNTACCGDSLIQ